MKMQCDVVDNMAALTTVDAKLRHRNFTRSRRYRSKSDFFSTLLALDNNSCYMAQVSLYRRTRQRPLALVLILLSLLVCAELSSVASGDIIGATTTADPEYAAAASAAAAAAAAQESHDGSAASGAADCASGTTDCTVGSRYIRSDLHAAAATTHPSGSVIGPLPSLCSMNTHCGDDLEDNAAVNQAPPPSTPRGGSSAAAAESTSNLTRSKHCSRYGRNVPQREEAS